MTGPTLARRAAIEAVATALLLAAVVGSGIMAARLAGGNAAIALLANTVATGAALVALILTFGPISGCHMNPVVSVVDVALGGRSRSELLPYVAAQVAGGIAGVALANVMFELPAFTTSRQMRTGYGQWIAEAVATFGLVLVVFLGVRHRPSAVPFAVGGYITAAYWFTSSTSFANPAVTIARSLSDTFAGIRPADVPAFVGAQAVGATVAASLLRWLAAGASEPAAGASADRVARLAEDR